MAQLSSDLLKQLLGHASPAALSIYMPVHTAHTPPATHEDQIQFKNLYTQALKAAEATPDLGTKDLQAVSRRLEQLEGDLAFWEAQRGALAIFASPGQITTVALPIDSGEYAAVDNIFHVAPLLGLLPYLISYRLLVVSQKEPLLFDGDAYELRAASIALPASGHSGSLQLRQKRLSHLGAGRLDAQPEYFGGPFPVVNSDERFNFFRVLDRSLQADKRDIRPLLLAGTEEDTADFRSIATYPQLLAASLPNVITATDLQRLAPDALDIVYQELLYPEFRDILARYEQLEGEGSGQASHDPEAISQAATAGRIDTLIFSMLTNTTDSIGSHAQAHTKLTLVARELMPRLNSLALQTWQTGGRVVLSTIASSIEPHDYPIASAIFRY